MFILLPPSEGKSSADGSTCFREDCPEFVDDVSGVLKHLKTLKVADRPNFYGVSSPEKAKAAHALNLAALEAPARPAIERYTGVVYTHIDYQNIANPETAHRRILIVSALFGLISADTPIPDYKLPMNPWLANYWRDRNAARLESLTKGEPVLDLLPQTYRQAIRYAALSTVDFRVAGGKKAAGHFGKAIKGRFVRWILENEVKKTSEFVGFSEDGYRYDGSNFIRH